MKNAPRLRSGEMRSRSQAIGEDAALPFHDGMARGFGVRDGRGRRTALQPSRHSTKKNGDGPHRPSPSSPTIMPHVHPEGGTPHRAWPAVSGAVFHSGWRESTPLRIAALDEKSVIRLPQPDDQLPPRVETISASAYSRCGCKLPRERGSVLEGIDVPTRKMPSRNGSNPPILSLSFAQSSFHERFLPSLLFPSGPGERARGTRCRRPASARSPPRRSRRRPP